MKRQILIFCHGYNAPFIDVCNQYVAVFDRTHYEISVAYLVGRADEKIKQKTLADNIYFLDQARRSVRGLKIHIIKELITLCRTKQFSVIICHRYKPAYIISLVSFFVNIPKIFAVMHELGTLKRRSRQLFVYLLGRKKLSFAGVSNAVRLDMLQDAKFLKPDKVFVLPNVLNIQQFEQQLMGREQARRLLGLPANEFIFGNIGRLVKNKDQASLITAFAKVVQQFPAAKLVIMGTGQLELALKRLVERHNIVDKVIFTGFVADASSYMPAFDVFISASIQEAFGRVLLEAMVGNVPIIATSVHGVPEVIGAAGILAPAKQPELLAKAMLSVLNKSSAELAELGTAGRNQIKNCFSLEKFSEIFLPLI